MTNGADLLANELMTSLLEGQSFDLPVVDLTDPDYAVPAAGPQLDLNDLTTKVVNGTGAFDALMAAIDAHLKREYEASRITGAEYSKAYTEMVQAAMANAVQFLVSKDTAYWQARIAQIQANMANVELETAKARLKAAQYEALTNEATYSLTKIKLANEDLSYATAKYNLDNTLPKQLLVLQGQLDLNAKQVIVATNQGNHILAETTMVNKQVEKLTSDIGVNTAQVTQLGAQTTLTNKQTDKLTSDILVNDAQIDQITEQLGLIKEQKEAQRAQTLDVRTDGATVSGLIAKQKSLYNQQVISYQRDAEVKAAKLFTDAWITMKTIDEGIVPPTGFANVSLDQVLTKLKSENGFV